MFEEKAGFLGAGNMGAPILTACVERDIFAPGSVFVFDPDKSKTEPLRDTFGINVCSSAEELAESCGVLVLCVKPQAFGSALPPLADIVRRNGTFVISIAAGKTTGTVSGLLGGVPVGRLFPNLNAKIGEAATAYCVGHGADEHQKDLTAAIAGALGLAVDYPEELFPVFGVLGGCAPAYTFMFIDSLAKAAEKAGMDPETALSVACRTVSGSAMLLASSGEAPETLIGRVCSKGGTTIEGVRSLEADGLGAVVEKAFNASLARDKALSGN
ncbi:MAG: pyrroline-5-carboxylate reductase [Clostridia bacterium]|nr:pyrroline-5-carboxylate reductase [Clostridia bacterium]